MARLASRVAACGFAGAAAPYKGPCTAGGKLTAEAVRVLKKSIQHAVARKARLGRRPLVPVAPGSALAWWEKGAERRRNDITSSPQLALQRPALASVSFFDFIFSRPHHRLKFSGRASTFFSSFTSSLHNTSPRSPPPAAASLLFFSFSSSHLPAKFPYYLGGE